MTKLISPDDIINLQDPFTPLVHSNVLSDEYVQSAVRIASSALLASYQAQAGRPFVTPKATQELTAQNEPQTTQAQSDVAEQAFQKVPKQTKAKAKAEKKKRSALSNIAIFVAAFGGVMLIRFTGILATNRVEGPSMEPNFHTGNIVATSSLAKIDRYDVVTAKAPTGTQVIKRVIGMPGDIIDVIDGHVYVDGAEADESFVNEKNYNENTETMTYTLDKDEYFLVGDNRMHSTDSRDYGPVKKKMIHGQVLFDIPLSIGGDDSN